MPSRTHRSSVTALLCVAGLASAAAAQDSVSVIPGASDALDVYNASAVNRYVVDSVPVTSSWGGLFRIAPILKANADDDPLFSTQALGSAAASPDQLTGVVFTSIAFAHWTTPGAGINTVANSAPGSINAAGFARQFGIGFSDFASVATNSVGAIVGQITAEPNRFFVTRTLAASSRIDTERDNTSTQSLGAIDASGNLFIRADNFGCAGAQVAGENIVRINLPTRNSFNNTLFFTGTTNRGDQIPATTFLLNGGTTTTNTPACIPQSGTASVALVLDFANLYRANGGAGVSTHLAAGIGFHRGNPSYSTVNSLGGVGTSASLARTPAGTRTDSLNLFAVDSAGAVVATRGATLPANITDGQGFTANTASNAEFLQYLSQTTFRGGNGQVAIGLDPLTATYVAAATATDPTAGEFIAVARFGGAVTWTVAAHEGKNVVNGASGSPIGTIANGAPISISAPGADLQGNIYFVAAFQPTVGMQTTALIKAVNTAAGYRLERIIQAGDSFAGANSGRTYTIEKLTLGDSDSIASGSFFSSHVLQQTFPNHNPTGAADPRSFGGAIVNAQIAYNNNGTPEPYQAVLLITPDLVPPPPVCQGDANGDNMINFSDVTTVLANFGNDYSPATGPGDANHDGPVNFADITSVLANFGGNCL